MLVNEIKKSSPTFVAIVEWIASEAWWTRADGIMVDHLTQGVSTTHSWTRILALLIDTRLVLGTIRRFETLRLAVGWFAKVSWLALTDWSRTKNGTD